MSTPALELKEFSVTVHIGESVQHDYLSIHPALLEAKRVTPEDWEAESHQHGSGFFIVDYKDGVQLFGTMSSLTIYERQELELGAEKRIIGIIQNYMEKVAPQVFQSVVLSWTVQFSVSNSTEWLSERFVSPNLTLERWEEVHVLPTIMLVAGGHTLIVRFPPMEGSDLITVECEIQAPMTTEGEMLEWLSRYFEHERAMLCGLNSLMEGNNANTN